MLNEWVRGTVRITMARVVFLLGSMLLWGCGGGTASPTAAALPVNTQGGMERVAVAPDGRGFVLVPSGRPFVPWGLNYGNNGRLIEDYWEKEWQTVADDFREMKELGANVARVHLQYGKFMRSADTPNSGSLERLWRLLDLAETTGIYLDVTGLACYRPSDTPAWYNAMGESDRWAAQARFWKAVAADCANSPAVFCYDFINEPLSPADKRKPGEWGSGSLFGGYDFLQWIALDPAGRSREEIAVQWIRAMSLAIRKHDHEHLITVGMLPWRPDWGHFSGFVPKKVARELDFVSIHIYPEKGKAKEALEALRQVVVGKPVVIEETFPLSCGREELTVFLRESKEIACGWLGHYDGRPPEELRKMQREGTITIAQAIYLDWYDLFVSLRPEFVGP